MQNFFQILYYYSEVLTYHTQTILLGSLIAIQCCKTPIYTKPLPLRSEIALSKFSYHRGTLQNKKDYKGQVVFNYPKYKTVYKPVLDPKDLSISFKTIKILQKRKYYWQESTYQDLLFRYYNKDKYNFDWLDSDSSSDSTDSSSDFSDEDL